MGYKVSLTTKIDHNKLKTGSGIIAIEPEDYSDAEIRAIRKKGYKVLAYLSIGTIEKERPWYSQFKKDRLKQLPDWPKEYYMDLRKQEWRSFLLSRAQKLKARGFDGWWLDNLDVYSEYKSSSFFAACKSLLSSVRRLGGYVMVNGGSEWIDDAADQGLKLASYLSGYTQEEVFTLIKDYSGKGRFGRQRKTDSDYYKRLLLRAKKNGVAGFVLEYTRDSILAGSIRKWCSKNRVGCCISGNVDL